MITILLLFSTLYSLLLYFDLIVFFSRTQLQLFNFQLPTSNFRISAPRTSKPPNFTLHMA